MRYTGEIVAEPIETAPRDGSHIIGLAQYGWREMWFVRDQIEGEYWMDAQDSEPTPSHWVRLPTVRQQP
jgi:hypothetical protein